MTDLNFNHGNNIAGVYLIRYVPLVGVTSLPSPVGATVNGQPSFKVGYRFFEIYGTQETKSYQEEPSEGDQGTIWTVSAGLFLPGDSDVNRASLSEMMGHKFIIECQDNVGVWRRAGTRTEPLSFSYKFGVAAGMGGKRGATLTFSGPLLKVPPIILGL